MAAITSTVIAAAGVATTAYGVYSASQARSEQQDSINQTNAAIAAQEPLFDRLNDLTSARDRLVAGRDARTSAAATKLREVQFRAQSVELRRARRQTVRDRIVARGTITNNAGNSGAGLNSSGVQGGLANVDTTAVRRNNELTQDFLQARRERSIARGIERLTRRFNRQIGGLNFGIADARADIARSERAIGQLGTQTQQAQLDAQAGSNFMNTGLQIVQGSQQAGQVFNQTFFTQ